MTRAGRVIPVEVDAAEGVGVPVGFDVVVLLQDGEEITSVLVVGILDSKVIDDEDEGDGLCRVLPIARGVRARQVTMGGKAGAQEFICEFTGLGQSVHAFFDSDVDPPMGVDEVEQVILVNDFLWNESNGYAHEFRAVEWGIEVKVFKVPTDHLGAGRGED